LNEYPRDAEELTDPDAHKEDESAGFLDRPQKNSDTRSLQAKRVSDKSRDLKEESDLIEVLATEGGVRFIVRLLNRCGIDAPVFHPSNSVMCEVAGRRQIANDVRTWIKDAGLEYWFRVEQEFELLRAKPKTSERRPKT
jgi:hypothetical protein